MFEHLSLARENSHLVITLSRSEKLNAFNLEMIQNLGEVIQAVAEDPAIRAVIITGDGRAFCSGGDISWEKSLGELPRSETVKIMGQVQAVFSAIDRLPQPVIAAVNGVAIGGGCELAMACDIRVAGTSAVFSHPETILGIVPPLGATQRLPRLIGLGRAKYMLFTGARVLAQQAYDWGLADFLVPDDQLLSFCEELARYISKGGHEAIRATKACINELYLKDFTSNLELQEYADASRREENRERLRRFLSARPKNPRND